MRRQKEPKEPRPEPGSLVLRHVRYCERCGGALLSRKSMDRRMGHTCYEKTFGETEYARLEAQGQVPMRFSEAATTRSL